MTSQISRRSVMCSLGMNISKLNEPKQSITYAGSSAVDSGTHHGQYKRLDIARASPSCEPVDCSPFASAKRVSRTHFVFFHNCSFNIQINLLRTGREADGARVTQGLGGCLHVQIHPRLCDGNTSQAFL